MITLLIQIAVFPFRILSLFLPEDDATVLLMCDGELKKMDIEQITSFYPQLTRLVVRNTVSFRDLLFPPLLVDTRRQRIKHHFGFAHLFPDRILTANSAEYEFTPWRVAEFFFYHEYRKKNREEALLAEAESRFRNLISRLKDQNEGKPVLVFGTGPSISHIDFSKTGSSVVLSCNSFVKNSKAVEDSNLAIITAIDGNIYLGSGLIADLFYFDVNKQMTLHKGLYFCYPANYHLVVVNRIEKENQSRLIPIPRGWTGDLQILTRNFELPNIGNTLNMLLLPIAFSISKHIVLFGFDGQSPVKSDEEQSFSSWKHGSEFSYDDYFLTIKRKDPAFYQMHADMLKSKTYVNTFHADLDENLKKAEEAGYKIEMAHPSFIPALAKRFTLANTHYFHAEWVKTWPKNQEGEN